MSNIKTKSTKKKKASIILHTGYQIKIAASILLVSCLVQNQDKIGNKIWDMG